MADDEPIHLVFKSNVRVSGELLHGEVHLNFPLLMKSKVEEVHVKLRGAVATCVLDLYTLFTHIDRNLIHTGQLPAK